MLLLLTLSLEQKYNFPSECSKQNLEIENLVRNLERWFTRFDI